MADKKYHPAPTEPPPSYTDAVPVVDPSSNAKPKPPLPRPLPLDLPALNVLRGKRVVLASASPRRKRLLAQIGLVPEIIPSHFPETIEKSPGLSPFEYVLATATEKCQAVYAQLMDPSNSSESENEPALVLGADTIVVTALGEILEKPRSEAEHLRMLKGLRDQGAHKVYTAVVVMAPLESASHPGYALRSAVEETVVRFDKMVTDDLILSYVRTREGADKAGGYGIQGLGSILVDRIEGTWDNVVGLPLRATLKCIEKVTSGDEEEFALEEED